MRPLSLALRVTALIRPLPLSLTGGAASRALLFRPRLLLLLLLLGGGTRTLLLLLFLLTPECFGLELVPFAANVLEPVVNWLASVCD
jgi:hypothetical protein